MKTLAGWHAAKCDLGRYLSVGDPCGDCLVSEMREALPPLRDTDTLMQASEPVTHVNGRGTFTTFRRVAFSRTWWYAGLCFAGQDREPPTFDRALAWAQIAWPNHTFECSPGAARLDSEQLAQIDKVCSERGYRLLASGTRLRVEPAGEASK